MRTVDQVTTPEYAVVCDSAEPIEQPSRYQIENPLNKRRMIIGYLAVLIIAVIFGVLFVQWAEPNPVAKYPEPFWH